MDLYEFDQLMREMLAIDDLPVQDISLNGLQVERTNREIHTVVFAVDASLESFRRAAAADADLLFVHHGLLWSQLEPLQGTFYQRIRFLIEKDIALYAVHLPLDLHPELGNNIGLAEILGLTEIQPFGVYKGIKIGCKGRLPQPKPINAIRDLICRDNTKALGLLPFGPAEIKSVGIVSGGDPQAVFQAITEQLDLFITGDASHEIYHSCLEAGINVLFAGHYITETPGIRRVAAKLKTISDINIKVLDIPTGL